MSKIRVTPIPESGVEPFEISGHFILTYLDDEFVYHADGQSFPASIVTILEEDTK